VAHGVAVGAFVLAVGGLIWAERALRRRREVEEADAALEEAFEAIERDEPKA
jgi:hypothetical protein